MLAQPSLASIRLGFGDQEGDTPWRGSMRSCGREKVPRDFLYDGSDYVYLPRTKSFKRRLGQTIKFDTISSGHEATGLLPALMGVKGRHLEEHPGESTGDGIPTLIALATKETMASASVLDDGRFACVWIRDQVLDSNYTMGAEYSTASYPSPGSEQTYKYVPLRYESGDGGLTRGVDEFQRRFFVPGSRKLLRSGRWVYAPSLLGTPSRWLPGATASQALATSTSDEYSGGWGVIDGLGGGNHSLALRTNDGGTTYSAGADHTQTAGGAIGVEVSLTVPTAPATYVGWKLHIVAAMAGSGTIPNDTTTVYANRTYNGHASPYTGGSVVKSLGTAWLRDQVQGNATYQDLTYTFTESEATVLASATRISVNLTCPNDGSGSGSAFETVTQIYLSIPGSTSSSTSTASRLIPSGPLPPLHAGTIAAGDQIENNAIFIRPDSDVTPGVWTASGGGSLFDDINTSAGTDTGDYITSTDSTVSEMCEVGLGNFAVDPAADETVIIQGYIRAGGTAPNLSNLTVHLMEGATIRSGFVAYPLATGNFQQWAHTLTISDIASITDWTNLRLRFTKGATATACSVQVSSGWVEHIGAGTAIEGGWRGADRFLYSVAYRFEDDSIWAPCVPRTPNDILGTSGFNMFTVDQDNPTAGYESIIWSNIPVGPFGVKSRILLRSTKIDSRTESTLQLDPTDLRIVWEIQDNTTTTYADFYADDDALGLDSSQLLIRYDHIMTPRARYIFGGDDRVGVSYGGANPSAIILAPVGRAADYDLNYDDETASLYNYQASFYQLKSTSLVLIQTPDATTGATNIKTITLGTLTLEQLVDTINATSFAVDGQQWRAQIAPGANPQALATSLMLTQRSISCGTVNGDATVTGTGFDAVAVGSFVMGSGITAGTYVRSVTSATSLELSANATGTGTNTLRFSAGTGDAPDDDTLFSQYDGWVRVIAGSLPGFLYFNQTYLDGDPIKKDRIWLTVGTPGATRAAANSWSGKIANRHEPSEHAGISMGGFSVGNGFVVPFSLKTAVIRNQVQGDAGTGIDEEYKLQVIDDAGGCIAWQSVAKGAKCGVIMKREGLFVCDLESERLCSDRIYKHPQGSPTGGIGDFASAVPLLEAATAADDDSANLYCRIMRGVLFVNYDGDGGGSIDRQLTYDFSADQDSSGLASMFRPDGSPYGWSMEHVRSFTVMCEGRRDDGAHLYGWNDANLGSTGDGRIDEFETGETDNGTAIAGSVTTGWLKGDPSQLTVHEAQVEHSSPTGSTGAFVLHWDYSDVTYSTTPSTGTTDTIRDNVQFDLAARTPTPAFYLAWSQATGSARTLKGIDVLVERLPIRGRGPSYT